MIKDSHEYPTYLLAVSSSHPAMAWTVVELSLLGSSVGQIVSWLTHQEEREGARS